MPTEFDYQDPQQPAAQPPKQNDQISLEDFEEMARQKYGVPKNLLRAMVGQESGGQPDNGWGATSPTGVKGKYQVTEATAKQYGLDRNDPFQQTVAAMKHLRTQYDALGNIKDDNARWLSAVGRYYGGNDAVAPDGRISTSSPDGVSNPLKHMERVANNWKSLGLDGGQSGSNPAPNGNYVAPQPAPKRQAPTTNAPIPNLIKQVAGPNATQSLISGALADTKAQSDAINAQMKQPINIGGVPQASGAIPKGAINIQQPTGPLPSRQQAQDVQADQQARQIIAQRQARRRPVPAVAQQPASATLDPNKTYTGNAGVDELIQHGVSAFNRGVQGGVGMLATPLEGLALAQDASQQRMLDKSAPDFADWRGEQAPMAYSGIKELTEPVKQATANMFPTLAPEKIDNFWENVLPSTLGGQAAFMVMNHIAKGGPMTGAMLGSLMGISQGYEDAIASGADQQTALKAAALNSAPGALQAFGLGRNLAGAGGVRSVLGRVANVAEQGGVMAGQRAGLNTIANNIVGYDPNRPTGEGVPEAFGLGALGGAIPEVGGALLARRQGRMAPYTPEELAAFKQRQGAADEQSVRDIKSGGVQFDQNGEIVPPAPAPPPVAPTVGGQPAAPATGQPKGRFAAKVATRQGQSEVTQTVTPEAPVAKPASVPESKPVAAGDVEILASGEIPAFEKGKRVTRVNVDGQDVLVRIPRGMHPEEAKIRAEMQIRSRGVENAPQPEPGPIEAQPGITQRDATTQDKATGEVPLPAAAPESLPVRPVEPTNQPVRGAGMETAPVETKTAETVNQPPIETPKVVESPIATEPTTEAPVRPSDVYRRNGIDITDETAAHVDRRHAARETEEKGALGKLGEFARKALFLTGKEAPERAFAEHPALRKILGLPEIPKELYEGAPKDWAQMAQHTMDALAETVGVPRSSRIDEGSLDKVEDYLAGKIDHRNPEHRNLAEVYGQTRAAVDIAHGRVDDLFADPTVKAAIQKAQAHLDSGKALRGAVRTELVKTLEAAQDRINKGQPGIEGQSDADVTGLKPNAIKDFITDLSTGRLSGDPKGWLGKQFRDIHAKSYSGETGESVHPSPSEQGERSPNGTETRSRPAQPDTPARSAAEPAETAPPVRSEKRQGDVAAKEPWRMTREEYFNDEDAVRRDLKEQGKSGYVVKYTYDNPNPGGPFKGQSIESRAPKKGDSYKAVFGDATITSVSSRKVAKAPIAERYEEAKANHKAAVTKALSEGKPVPPEVLADYPDLAAKTPKPSEGEGFTTSAFGVGALRKFNDAQLSTIASHFKAHADNFVAWGKAMIADFGASIRPKLREIWDGLKKFHADELGSAKVSPGGPPIEDSVPKKGAREKVPLPGDFNAEKYGHDVDKIIADANIGEAKQAKVEAAFDRMLEAMDANDGAALAKSQVEIKDLLKNTNAVKFADLMRPLNATGEFSPVGRQGWIGWLTHPKISVDAFAAATGSDEGAMTFLAKQLAKPNMRLMKESGLDLGMLNEINLSKSALSREENTTSRWPEKLPVIGKGFGYIERFNKTFLEGQRIGLFEAYQRAAESRGAQMWKTDTAGKMTASDAAKQIAKQVNIITGRGDIPDNKIAQAVVDVGSVLAYSPRFAISRFQAADPTRLYRVYKKSPEVAKSVIADYAKQLVAYTALAGALKASGFQVNLTDPDDPDFLKAKIGNFRVPIVQGGLQPAMRFAAKMAKRGYEIAAGDKGNADGRSGAWTKTGRDIGSFLRQKEAPMAGFVHDQLFDRKDYTDAATQQRVNMGTNAIGQPVSAGRDFAQHILPMYFLQTIESAQNGGAKVGAATGILEGVGLSSGYYDSGRYGENQADGLGKAKLKRDWSYSQSGYLPWNEGMEPLDKFHARVSRADKLYGDSLPALRATNFYQSADDATKKKMEENLTRRIGELSYDEQPNESKLSPGSIISSEQAGEKRRATNLRKRANRSW